MSILKDKVALVTGAGSGIGKQVALKYAAEGAKVVVSDIVEEGGKETVAEIKAAGGEAIFIKADTGKAEDNERLVAQTLEQYGALHIACNNAGIGGPIEPTGAYPLDGWEKVIRINLSGVFYGMRYQLPAILKSGGGNIINMASILGKVGFANSAAYVAAKHGVIGLTETAAVEYSAQGVRVNAVGPGFIKTPLVESSMDQESKDALVALHPIGRLGEPEEVAELVLWLSSDKASFVTGAYYNIDGGYLAR
ncbi:SDR family NAD(P)-dependent oxidoreductase [Taibaiella chishuiensis]|uniref:NAD(P)-dependent dehydrogenase (Short-subunit alcohol dehydrogenase family) n=1 Tax=Taibaiella chishuiensis TaxID=1434707 RepID=A0A2P8D4E1_9BACT|nr:glucose 1-dehydrogenase [Taibaiella chishuiensis]PSK92086.1 NAD(P)-dependent dehydrogenase (short-subunit alcohol dehydrogenase family) [Taibaiella chishuiensis]